MRRLPIAILWATPYNCIFDALRKFCARILLRFLAIHQVLPRNRAASGRKIYTQIILAELCGIALKILQNILTAGINYDVESISVGQRQLLTIARGVLRDPAVLILDEATSSVDTCTEHEINRAMMVLMKNRISFVIAHRLSTIVDADLILVMETGNIIEQGNHDSLMPQGGAYAELYNSQFAS